MKKTLHPDFMPREKNSKSKSEICSKAIWLTQSFIKITLNINYSNKGILIFLNFVKALVLWVDNLKII